MLWIILAGLLVVVLGAAAYGLLVPQGVGGLRSRPRPARDYAEALARIEALRAREGEDFNALCRTILMSHGQKAARAMVFAHGYTACPEQFRALGERFFALGYNVLIAPLPHHGLADLLSPIQGRLLAEELAAYADEVVDIGRGLGEHVTLAGLSGGGVTTAWAAQVRSDLDQAVVISAALGVQAVRRALTIATMNIALALPDEFIWWDPVKQDKTDSKYGYPRFSRRGLAQILRLGFATLALARTRPPGARSIVVVTNAHDPAVDNWAAQRLAAAWRQRGAPDLRAYEFPGDLALPHDLIDPANPGNQPEVVYPKLVELVEAGARQGGLRE